MLKKLFYKFLSLFLVIIMLISINFHPIYGVLPDGEQDFTGYTFSGETGTSPDGFFTLTASKSGLMADGDGAFINGGDTIGETVYFEITSSSSLGSFVLDQLYVGEYADGNFSDVTVKGYANETQVFSTTPYSSSIDSNIIANFPIDYSSAAGKSINKFRVYYTLGTGTGNNDFNLVSFTIGEASVDEPVVTYNTTYNGNSNTGGNVPTDATDYSSGSSVTVKTNSGSLVKTGYTFSGWNTSADGSGTDYAAGSGSFSITSDTTLYAKWSINTYNVTYSGNGNTGGSIPT
ncbi:MAG: InlB B-repeat-containing protein, partial [Clostridiales bacterium]